MNNDTLCENIIIFKLETFELFVIGNKSHLIVDTFRTIYINVERILVKGTNDDCASTHSSKLVCGFRERFLDMNSALLFTAPIAPYSTSAWSLSLVYLNLTHETKKCALT